MKVKSSFLYVKNQGEIRKFEKCSVTHWKICGDSCQNQGAFKVTRNNVHQHWPLICMQVHVGWCREWRRAYPFIPVSLLSSSIQTHHSPGHQRGFPLLSFLSTLCFIPSSLVSHHLLLTLLLRKKDAERTLHHIHHGGKWGGYIGVFFCPFSLMWLYSGSVYPSITTSLSCKLNPSCSRFIQAPFHLSFFCIFLSFILLTLIPSAIEPLYALHRSSLFASHGVCGLREHTGLSGGLREHLCRVDW